MGVNICYLELMFILANVFQQQKLTKKGILTKTLFLKKKTKSIRKKLGCKCIRIDTSNAKNGYDLDYEVGNVQAFIDEFKNKKIKKTRKKINKRKRTREKSEKEMKRNQKKK